MIYPIVYVNQTAEELFGSREELTFGVEEKVRKIIADVKNRGDTALMEYARAFDGFTGGRLEVTREEIDGALSRISPRYMSVLKRSVANVRAFHERQQREGFELRADGAVIGQRVIPIARAGIYVPGGTAAYPSTVIMNAVPAKIAGVREIVMCTPAKADGKVRDEVLAAAALCGVDRIFKVGGAQAIAALAYGTQTVPKVDKITGPGRDFVACAKKLVSGLMCGIDMLAGPSEILVIADGGADPALVAADMLSQAEHDVNASALLLTDSAKLAKEVDSELERQLESLPRREIAKKSLEVRGRIIVCDMERAAALADEYAPEHLELCVKEPEKLFDKISNAGSVFLGYNTPEAVGDYFAGANHTLPTSGTARFSSPLGVDDFVKTTQYIYYTEEKLKGSARDIADFARSEGLEGHARSVTLRCGDE